ncbi:squalene/phytoene synthase family protein [Phenylobacterium sp.]|uniref:squalene/phytoene synthase family protein n=1 Tax=Phenylobacterium sp. TaxID=1871053 RepID=UPI0025D09D95|nr:squalene/phytoene synthase family protein [Phenylobacterium sp.]MCA3715901.1 squalene/phytoene synthase family protein [Phenylobacterium sp.]
MSTEPSPETDPSFPDNVEAGLSRTDPDRWLSSRFAPGPAVRRALVALYAFDNELGRAPRAASNPLVAEMRLAWWREVLEEIASGRAVRRHPVALALADVVRTHGLDRGGLEGLVDARLRELDPRPMVLEEALEWAEGTGGACARLAAAVLDPACDPAAAGAGGAAWSIGRLILTAGLSPEAAREALESRLLAARGVTAAAFPAVAHAALARARAKGRPPSPLGDRLRLMGAVLTGRV